MKSPSACVLSPSPYPWTLFCDPQDDDDDEVTPGYSAPKKVDLKTLQELDADDESLVKYKAQLLGQTADVKGLSFFPPFFSLFSLPLHFREK